MTYGSLGIHSPAPVAALPQPTNPAGRIQPYRCCCGPLIRVVQAIAAFIYQIFIRIGKWLRPIPPEQKMINNFFKALKEHGVTETILPLTTEKPTPLGGVLGFGSDIGDRPEMQDRSLYVSGGNCTCSGIFDGHGTKGGEAAQEAVDFFQEKFVDIVKSSPDIRTAFHRAMKMAHEQMAPKYPEGGTTAVVCLIDNKTNLIYTGTLGDSEAKIYREINGKLTCIPLSCVRNWTSAKDQARAKAIVPTDITYPPGTKALRFHPKLGLNNAGLYGAGLNVSRCLGDGAFSPPCAPKPKVTECQLLSGDIVVEASDGLWDFVTPEELTKKIEENKKGNLAQKIVAFALEKGKEKKLFPRDNIAVNVLNIC